MFMKEINQKKEFTIKRKTNQNKTKNQTQRKSVQGE